MSNLTGKKFAFAPMANQFDRDIKAGVLFEYDAEDDARQAAMKFSADFGVKTGIYMLDAIVRPTYPVEVEEM